MHFRTAKGPTGASTMSTTPAMHALPVSLTLAKTCFAGVIVNDTGNACIAGVVVTGEAPK